GRTDENEQGADVKRPQEIEPPVARSGSDLAGKYRTDEQPWDSCVGKRRRIEVSWAVCRTRPAASASIYAAWRARSSDARAQVSARRRLLKSAAIERRSRSMLSPAR